MYQYDFIGIKSIKVEGFKKPVLTMIGTCKYKTYSFEIYIDGRKVRNNLEIDKSNNYLLTAKLKENNKKIEIFFVNKKEGKKQVYSGITNKYKRLIKSMLHLRKKVEFYNCPNIGINNFSIDGIRNPMITIVGTSKKQDFSFEIVVDGKKKEYRVLPTSSLNDFIVISDLGSTAKMVKLYYIDEKSKDKTLFLSVKTTKMSRIIRKIKGVFRIFFYKVYRFFRTIFRGIRYIWKEYHFLVPLSIWKKLFNDFKRSINSSVTFYNPNNISDYNKWLNQNKEKDEKKKVFKYKPLISIIIPVYNAKKNELKECIESVLNQTYDNYEICIVDDKSTKDETKKCLKEISKLDKRINIKYRKENGNISIASNDAIKMAKGEFIGLLDNDDVLANNALYEVVKVLNENKDLDMIYSDEDKLYLDGKRCYPNFKPDYSPDTLMGLNYICHFTVLRKSIVDKIGGFEVGLEGAQDHDLFLKFVEETNRIYHIPKILYHWRMSETSTSMSINNKKYAKDKGMICVQNAISRRGLDATVTKDEKSTYYVVDYKIKKEPLISIIICTRDYASTLETCLESLYKKTTYKNFEVIVVNNGSKEKETYKLFNKYEKKHDDFRVIDSDTEFNFSYLNNLAVKKSKGEYIVLLNNDTEIISPDWLNRMIGYASLPHIGAVGPKLLYPDTTVQHAGVIMGLGGVASHAYIGASREDVGIYGRMAVPYNYSAVTGACLMVSKKKFNEVNGLEEELKVAYNDIDFCMKLLDKGYYNLFIPNVELFHYESKSRGLDTTSEKYKRFQIESKYMYKKWNSIIKEDPFYNPNYSKKGWFMLDRK